MFTKMMQRSTLTASAEEIERLADRCGLSVSVAQVLYARGVDTENKIARFLSPSLKDLHDPYLLTGMQELVDRLLVATENGETVVIYGDYDADGICATAILTGFLSSRGANVVPYIPSRKSDGYGVTLDTLLRLIDEALPDLILTCDCGISAHDEFSEIADSGIDVFVTDHHEIPRVLPDCVCIDPHLPGAYPFDGLCGAGVALKVVQAMAGEKDVLDYIDLAAVATIADLVPLVDENRAIVTVGLQRINRGKGNKGFSALTAGMGVVTSTDIAYRIAPRINAAGRMGDACRAFQLLISEDASEIAQLTASIDADNALRKETGAVVYKEAVSLIRCDRLADCRCLVLWHPDWEKGLTSIVAAQIAGEYRRPTFLIVKNGDSLKGTARSVDGVSLYDLLRSCEDLLIEYGGHAQAAGFSIAEGNVDAFRDRVENYLRQNYPPETFLPNGCFDAELAHDDIDFALAKELDKLEPFGNANPRPVFRVTVDNPVAEPMRGKPQHLSIKIGNNKINAFNYGKCYSIFHEKGRFLLNVELSVNRYQGRDYLSAALRDFDFNGFNGTEKTSLTDTSALYGLARADETRKTVEIADEGIDAIFSENKRCGTLFVAYTRAAYLEFVRRHTASDQLWHSIYTRETGNNYNRIVLAPTPDFDAFGYDRIVLLEAGIGRGRTAFPIDPNAKVYVASGALTVEKEGLSFSRDVFVRCYKQLLDGAYGPDLPTALDSSRGSVTMRQTVACYAVFVSLGLASFDAAAGQVVIDSSKKCELSNSAGYRLLEE